MKTRKAVTRTLILWIAVALVLSTTGFSAHQAGPLPADVRTSPDGKGYRFDQNGWLYVHIEGQPRERGFQHGYLVAPELKEILRVVKFMVYEETGMKWEFFVDAAEELFAGRIEQEYLDEIRGIAEGAKAAGTDISWQEVLTWNGYEELTDYWWPNQAAKWYGSYSPKDNEHCSAFIATGSYTKDGKVVVAHNSWNDYVVGVFANAILDVQPDKGHRIFMQSEPGFIASFTDFFVTDAGIMGTETTIGGYGQFDPNAAPEFARARQAMQYADNLDQFVAIMRKNNNGGYANSWLLADRNTGEIMRFELGLKFFNVERTKDGYFVGFNAAQDPRIRNLESSYAGYDDIRYPTGARRVRLTQLMERYKGQINVEIAEKILGDGFDVYLNKYNPSSRTVEGRYELDDRAVVTIPGRPPFQPRGALDGKVMDSDLAKALSLWARWGSSSGLAFDADEFLERHIQWSHLKGYLKSRPTQPWTLFAAGQKPAATAVSSSAPQALTLPAPAGKTPLKDALPNLEPKAVWENFYALTQIPRPSHHEEKVSAFLADFGKKLGLETTVDEVGNVLIRKPATKGMENRQGVILQAHIDMVPQKTPDKTHDFEKDPIQAYVEGSWVKADHTTLGADDGIGVAIIMAILQAKDLTHGPIEAFFTVNEEDGFTGVNALKPGALKGNVYINVDWETEGSFAIGSAGGVYVDANATYTEEKTPAGMAAYKLEVAGLQGGHSGMDIAQGRGSASKLLARLLWSAGPQFGARIATLTGGDRANAIPREATALVVVPTDKADALVKYVQDFERMVKSELAAAEPDLAVRAIPANLPAAVMDAKMQNALVSAVYGGPNGVIRMSDSVPGLVETSTSMGILKIEAGKFTAGMYVRSAVDSARDDVAQMIASVFGLAGAQVTNHGTYSGWRPNPDSAILGLMKKTYKDLYGAAPAVVAIHAGLETSVVGVRYPGMDMISVGPTLVAVHSPDERLEVTSVKKVYDLLADTLKQIPTQK